MEHTIFLLIGLISILLVVITFLSMRYIINERLIKKYKKLSEAQHTLITKYETAIFNLDYEKIKHIRNILLDNVKQLDANKQ